MNAFDEDRALRLLLQGTMGETGASFFHALVRNAAQAFEVDGAWVTEFLPDKRRLRALAFWLRGGFVESYEYDIAETPCEPVAVEGAVVHIPDRIVELFPGDNDLGKLKAASYLGVPLLDAQQSVIGHLGAIHSEPLPADSRLIALFELFAMRASAELQRLRAERRMLELTEEAEILRDAVHELPQPGTIIGNSQPIQKLNQEIARVAPTDATVLVLGETGTGKELVARAIHRASRRARMPLVRVNCAAVPANLIESEFFGHERGAFTGAISRREGRFAAADGGTIFLDEIGEMPLDLQSKLLRVLQEGEFEMVGSTKTRRVDVRVIAATNRDLLSRVSSGCFREDLYYRLCVFPIDVPALRERGQDIVLLAETFAARFSEKMGVRLHPLIDSDRHRLLAYPWPGNVRELQNVIERAIILSTGGLLNLPSAMPNSPPPASFEQFQRPATSGSILSDEELREMERCNIRKALEACRGKVAGSDGAAARLGIPASTLTSRMKKLGIERTRA